MLALQITAPRETRLIEVAPPEPKPGEVLLRVRRVGYCGTDLSTFEGRNPLVSYPRIPGHEIGATIEAVGSGVAPVWTLGQAVTVVPYSNCGHCASCRRGRAHACRRNQTLGVQRDGAMTSLLAVPQEKLIAVPGLGVRELALVEPLTVGFHAIARGDVTTADIVAVFGCGLIGLGAIAGAAERGATVVAVDLDDSKLELARRLGAHHTVNARSQNLHDTLQTITNGEGPDVCVEAVGHAVTYRQAVEEVAFTGRVVCIGYAKEDVSFATRLFVQKELDIRGSRNAAPEDFRRVAAHLARGGFPYDQLISREVSLAEAGAAIAEWSANPTKITKISVVIG
jgi:L-galactonate 5-dehydrogenase